MFALLFVQVGLIIIFFCIYPAFLVFLIALVFAEKSRDETWMPRPWMNYLSWSFGLCVLSGFFSAFAGMCLFLLALIYKVSNTEVPTTMPLAECSTFLLYYKTLWSGENSAFPSIFYKKRNCN